MRLDYRKQEVFSFQGEVSSSVLLNSADGYSPVLRNSRCVAVLAVSCSRIIVASEISAGRMERNYRHQQTMPGQELLSICARSSAMEANLTVPCGSFASMEPSA